MIDILRDIVIGLKSGSGVNWIQVVFSLLAYAMILLVALPVHELSHGLAAEKMGDPTARWNGRLTLNPLKHLDPFGTILILFFGFGYAKPVPINPNNFKNYKKGIVVTSIAGPLSNLIMSFLSLLILRIFYFFTITSSAFIFIMSILSTLLSTFAQLNISLFVFNMLPVPPLDGYRIVSVFLPERWRYFIDSNQTMVMFLVMMLIAAGAFSGLIFKLSKAIISLFMFILRF